MSVYSDAADYLDRYGWYQGSYYPAGTVPDPAWINNPAWINSWSPPPACVSGALACVAGSHKVWSMAVLALTHMLGDNSLAEWNDAPHRSLEDVKLLLKQADRAEAEGELDEFLGEHRASREIPDLVSAAVTPLPLVVSQ
jgi:hypothetical protein